MSTVSATEAPPSAPAAGSRTPRPTLARTLWFVMRCGLVPWVAFAVCCLSATVLVMNGAPWRGDLTWLIDSAPIAMIALGPIVAGAAAIDMSRLGEGSRHLESGRFWRTPAAAITFAYGLLVSGAYAATILVAAFVEVPGRIDGLSWLAVGVQLLMITAFAAVGTVLGRLVGPVLAGVLGALAALIAVLAMSSRSDHVALLYAGASTVPRTGRGYSGAYLAVQALLLVLVVVVCLVVRPGAPRRRRVAVGECLAAVGLVVAILLAGVAGPTSRLTMTGDRPRDCKTVHGVAVCLYAEHRRVGAQVRAAVGTLIEQVRAHGYDAFVPERIEESSRSFSPDGRSSLPLDLDRELAGGPVSYEVVVGSLVWPAHCEAVQGELPPSEATWNDYDAVTQTLISLVDPDLAASRTLNGDVERLSPDEVAAILEEFRACTYPF